MTASQGSGSRWWSAAARVWRFGVSLSFAGMILKHPPTPLSRGTPSATWRRLSFSSIRSKDGLYEEIKEHLRWNEPLGVTVSLLLEPRQPTADISLCHSHHSNVVISSTRSGATLTIPHAPSTCTSPVTSRINFFYDRHLSGVWGIYSVSTVHNKCFFFLSGQMEEPKTGLGTFLWMQKENQWLSTGAFIQMHVWGEVITRLKEVNSCQKVIMFRGAEILMFQQYLVWWIFFFAVFVSPSSPVRARNPHQ